MKLTDVDTNNKRDMEILRIIAEYVPKEQPSVLVKKETTQQEKVELARPETSKYEEIVIDNRQAESIFGLSATNILQNYQRNAKYGFDRIIRPAKSENRQRFWALGPVLIENMKPEVLEALKNGKSLKVPCVLPTQLINSALKESYGNGARVYTPTKKNDARDAKIFSLPRPGRTTFYLTFTDAWEKTNRGAHIAIAYYFQKKST
tara:strand:- start:587 stop:1201 length:615 start_codon:yes stop_codon:yes gene_type:complete